MVLGDILLLAQSNVGLPSHAEFSLYNTVHILVKVTAPRIIILPAQEPFSASDQRIGRKILTLRLVFMLCDGKCVFALLPGQYNAYRGQSGGV